MKIKKTIIHYIVSIVTSDGKVGFYDGTGFDTAIRKARHYKNKGIATIQAQKFQALKGVRFSGVFAATMKENPIKRTMKGLKKPLVKKRVVKKRTVKKKNPIAGSKNRRVEKAANLYENFTGHEADNITEVNLPNHDTGLKVGKCLGIMYETIRDGKKESYLHEFKRRSMPDFCISHDGQQIYLIGGSYLFKDSGINDT